MFSESMKTTSDVLSATPAVAVLLVKRRIVDCLAADYLACGQVMSLEESLIHLRVHVTI